jgi:hypothetical protein
LLQAIQNNPLFQDPDKRYVFAFPGGPQSDRLMHNPESNPDHFFKKCAELKDMEVESLLFTGNMVPMVEMFLRALPQGPQPGSYHGHVQELSEAGGPHDSGKKPGHPV